ncbi:MAG: endonuclease MutS2 [Anaerolineae bacterium]|jgi:DNA mismatch repair protein MutS2|nr:endonuclease MutS2 [Anaerolineae bacterium]
MNRHWVKLEYPEILKRLARHTDFSGGEALALALEPVFFLREAQELLALTSEARALLEAHPDFALGGVRDIRPMAARAQHGITLQPAEFLEVRSTLIGAERVQRVVGRLVAQFPMLADIASRIHVLPGLSDAIARVLDDRGEVRDSASPELARIRRELRVTQDRVQDRLRRLISSAEVAPYLQEALITRREGRFVIPVQADFKGHVQGIVHDRSSSGATLFMEPTQVVELNNALRELKLAEEEEVIRLLRLLSMSVGQAADEITHTLEALAELDLVMARARYAEALMATAPTLVDVPKTPPAPEGDNQNPGTVVRLKGARHPLIDPTRVVPVSIDVASDTHAVIITGPNTGGKTVALKTVGLLTLMAMSGMHIPVDAGSELSCFGAVYADIGDEQSIEQSLSTFSSHLTNILSFLDDVDHRVLVLLDELGAGTDPAEGSALARALLDALRRRRCFIFVATHYPELKLYAHNTPGVQNASMEFDVETLAPTFRLTIGLPGRSNAFAIAQRLGMPQSIVKKAQGMISGEELRAEDMLTDLHNLRIQEVGARDAARDAHREVDTLRKQLRERLAKIDQERRAILSEAEASAEAEVETLRSELRSLRTRMLLAPVSAAVPALDAVEEELDALETAIAAPEPLIQDVVALPAQVEARDVRQGDVVTLLSLGIEGIVLDVGADEVSVQAGSIRTRVPRSDVALVPRVAVPRAESAGISVPPRAASPGVQIDLRGQTVEEALERLERHIDEAAMASLPWVRIVHGKGTGKLRHEVRRHVARHPLVSSYEIAPQPEGGEGVTIIHLVTAR